MWGPLSDTATLGKLYNKIFSISHRDAKLYNPGLGLTEISDI